MSVEFICTNKTISESSRQRALKFIKFANHTFFLSQIIEMTLYITYYYNFCNEKVRFYCLIVKLCAFELRYFNYKNRFVSHYISLSTNICHVNLEIMV